MSDQTEFRSHRIRSTSKTDRIRPNLDQTKQSSDHMEYLFWVTSHTIPGISLCGQPEKADSYCNHSMQQYLIVLCGQTHYTHFSTRLAPQFQDYHKCIQTIYILAFCIPYNTAWLDTLPMTTYGGQTYKSLGHYNECSHEQAIFFSLVIDCGQTHHNYIRCMYDVVIFGAQPHQPFCTVTQNKLTFCVQPQNNVASHISLPTSSL